MDPRRHRVAKGGHGLVHASGIDRVGIGEERELFVRHATAGKAGGKKRKSVRPV
jgi:hypothetical protein